MAPSTKKKCLILSGSLLVAYSRQTKAQYVQSDIRGIVNFTTRLMLIIVQLLYFVSLCCLPCSLLQFVLGIIPSLNWFDPFSSHASWSLLISAAIVSSGGMLVVVLLNLLIVASSDKKNLTPCPSNKHQYSSNLDVLAGCRCSGADRSSKLSVSLNHFGQ